MMTKNTNKKQSALSDYQKCVIFDNELHTNVHYLENIIENDSGVFRNIRKTSSLFLRTKQYSKLLNKLKQRLKQAKKFLKTSNTKAYIKEALLIYFSIEDIRTDMIFSLENFDEKKNVIDYSQLYKAELFH